MSAATGPRSTGDAPAGGRRRPGPGAGAQRVPRPRARPLELSWEEPHLAARVADLMPRARGDLAELVAFRSVADRHFAAPEQCNQAARWVLGRYEEVGFTDVFLAETTDESRAVVGSTQRSSESSGPRVLLYAHYDVHPVPDEAAWRTPPFTLTEVDGRWYGRGAADCKGNILAHLTALRAIGDLSGVDLRLLVTGSAEQGGAVLDEFVHRHADLLRANVVLVCDSVGTPAPDQQAGTAGPAHAALSEALTEAYGEQRSAVVGGAGACAAFADAFPDAEVLSLGVADARSAVHGTDESVDPARLAATALTEALFLQRLARSATG